jgi:hypothetical protein
MAGHEHIKYVSPPRVFAVHIVNKSPRDREARRGGVAETPYDSISCGVARYGPQYIVAHTKKILLIFICNHPIFIYRFGNKGEKYHTHHTTAADSPSKTVSSRNSHYKKGFTPMASTMTAEREQEFSSHPQETLKERLARKKIVLSDNAMTVLEKRYLKKDDNGAVIETPEDLFFRIAENIASAEKTFNSEANTEIWTEKFYTMMVDLDFLPNSPTIMNAGRELQQLSACFVLPVGDSMEEIFTSVKNTALIHKSGGGTVRKTTA